MASAPEDPEQVRWAQKYPRYPGTEKCVELLCASNVRGGFLEVVEAELQRHATLGELIEAFHSLPSNETRARRLLIWQVGRRDEPAAVSFLETCATDADSDEDDRATARTVLGRMTSKDARSAHWRVTQRT